jgi:hypothetical protein
MTSFCSGWEPKKCSKDYHADSSYSLTIMFGSLKQTQHTMLLPTVPSSAAISFSDQKSFSEVQRVMKLCGLESSKDSSDSEMATSLEQEPD